MVACEDFILVSNTNEEMARKLNIAKKKKYTIMEGIKLYELITNQRNSQVGSQSYWLKIAQNGFLPERSSESMKNFWKKHSSKTLEEFLIECVHEGTDFCLNFKEIPNPDFISRFRTQYEREFEKLANLQNLSGKNNNESDDEARANGKQSASTMATLSR